MPDVLAILAHDGYVYPLSGLAIPADADASYYVSQLLWLLPGVALSVVLGLAGSGPVGRALRVRRAVAAAMIISLGVILSATLNPPMGAVEDGATGTRACDFSRLGLAPLAELVVVSETSFNVLLFIPLGVTIGLVARSRAKAVLLIGAILLPFAIEGAQLLPALQRGCQSADIVDNLTGLVLGLVVGTMAGRLAPWVADPGRSG